MNAVGRKVEAAYRARQAGDRATAAKSITLGQRDLQALPRAGDGRRHAGRAAAYHQHVGA
jgi:hypothetical protein